jgi:ubiquinone biosynthesis protein COQ9
MTMEDADFDRALIAAAFEQAALTGWRRLNLVEAAAAAGLPPDRVRARFPGRFAVLLRFGVIADQAALAQPSTEPLVRDRLFDLVMRRFDVLQRHRAGVLALLRDLPAEPGMALLLSAATGRSMGWLLEAAGVPSHGLRGRLRVSGMVGVWLYAVRAWRTDESADMAGVMAALDKALDRAEKLSGMFRDSPAAEPADEPLEGVSDVPESVLREEAASESPPPETPAPSP